MNKYIYTFICMYTVRIIYSRMFSTPSLIFAIIVISNRSKIAQIYLHILCVQTKITSKKFTAY